MPGREGPVDREWPWLPLGEVLFPHGRRALTLLPERHAGLQAQCAAGDGRLVVSWQRPAHDNGPGTPAVGVVATLAPIAGADADRVWCVTGGRVALGATRRDDAAGIWWCTAHEMAPAQPRWPAPDSMPAVEALAQAIGRLRERGAPAPEEPSRLDDAGWVADRWCEMLPVPLAAKQRLLELDDPQQRLRVVVAYLRSQQIIR